MKMVFVLKMMIFSLTAVSSFFNFTFPFLGIVASKSSNCPPHHHHPPTNIVEMTCEENH